jgi:hypothetical protein
LALVGCFLFRFEFFEFLLIGMFLRKLLRQSA